MITVLLLSLVNNEKNTLGFPAFSMTMRMRRCNAARISQWSTTRASRGATGRHHRAITRTVSPWRVRQGHRWQEHNKHTKKTFSFMVSYDIVHHVYVKLE